MLEPTHETGLPEDLLPEVYRELHALAEHYMSRERPSATLQPTVIVHEAYLRLHAYPGFRSRAHFLAVAAIAMRRVIIDHARQRDALKRGGGVTHVTVSDGAAISDDRVQDAFAVHQALDLLAAHDATAARIVEMRFFAGMTEAEVAEVLGISDRWVRKQWAYARAWLRRAMEPTPDPKRTGEDGTLGAS
jgi:RNA polymerase sigma factor (TIGR02999 family)